MIEGGCLCGGVRYAITGALADVQVCHCQSCQKAQGGPFATNIPVDRACFEWRRGEAQIRDYESSPGKQRVFCRECGSPIYSCHESKPGVVRIRAGLLNEPLATRPAFHIYTDSACNWWAIDDGLPQYPEGAG